MTRPSALSIADSITDEMLETWAKNRADDAGRLARTLRECRAQLRSYETIGSAAGALIQSEMQRADIAERKLVEVAATVRAAAIAECQAIVRGNVYKECYREWPWYGSGNQRDDSYRIKFCDAACAEMAALSPHSPDAKAALVERWQPIATAPKDGTVVLVCRFGSDHYWVMSDHWSIDAECWVDSDEPTHWQPLPAPPAKVPE